MRGLSDFHITFDLGVPFRPYEQLLGVLPAYSAHLLPPAYRYLMTEPHSPILDVRGTQNTTTK
jgi:5'-3' exonuclease